MDSRVSSGRKTSTSNYPGRFSMQPTTPRCTVLAAREWMQRSSWLICRSVFDSDEEFPTCSFPRGFPTPDITGQDWRAFRAHLVAWEQSARRAAERTSRLQRPPYPPFVSGNSWAHPLTVPEAGCLLLARRDDMAWLTGAVILITFHDNGTGSMGHVLNKASELSLGDLPLLNPIPGFQETFGSQKVQIGGEVHQDTVTVLHRFVGIRGSHKICEGMFMGGLADAVQLVSGGMVRPQDFTLVLGMCGWRPGQLVAEIEEGWWHVISASPDLVLPSPGPPPTYAASPSTHSGLLPQPSSTPASASDSGSGLAAPSHAKGDHHPHHHQDQTPRKCSDGDEADRVSGGRGKSKRRSNSSAESTMYRRIARLAVRGARRREAASG